MCFIFLFESRLFPRFFFLFSFSLFLLQCAELTEAVSMGSTNELSPL
jgi:hypothetical protein